MALKAVFETSEDLKKSREVAKNREHPLPLVRELTDAFTFFDLNGDGKLSVKELAKVVRSLGEEMAEEDLEKLIRGVDVDGDGYLDLHEFIDLNTKAINNGGQNSPESELCRQDSENHALVSAFNKFDVNRDGFISAEELHKVLVGFGDKKFSLEECRSMISGVDDNGDQLMSLQEFQALMHDNFDSQSEGLQSVQVAKEGSSSQL